MWKQWRHWLPEVLFIFLVLAIAFTGAFYSFFNQ